MFKKILAVALSATMLAASSGAGTAFAVGPDGEENDTVNIAVDGDCTSPYLLSQSESNPYTDWIYTMIYDRLISIDEDGYFHYDLVQSIATVPSEDGDGLGDGPNFTFVELDPDGDWETPPALDTTRYDSDFDWIYSQYDDIYNYGSGYFTIDIRLREGVYFQDGSAFTAQSVLDLINYAKSHRGTLINSLWSSVFSANYIDEYTIELQLSFGGSSGFVDFLYGLASPIGSIVKTDGGASAVAVGTGAYSVKSVIFGSQITLEQNEDWWKELSGSECVNFYYVAPEIIPIALESGDFDFGIAEMSEDDYDELESKDYKLSQIQTNPVAVSFTSNDETFTNENFRKAVAYAIDKNIIKGDLGHNFSLEKLNGFWMRDLRVCDQTTALSYFGTFAEEYGVPIEMPDILNLDILTTTANKPIADLIGWMLTAVLGVNTTVTAADGGDFKVAKQSGLFELTVSEIDMYNVNSAYNTLYSVIGDNADATLTDSKHAGNVLTYNTAHRSVQDECLNTAAIINIGSRAKVFAQNPDVSGFTLPRGFCPTGNLSRFDFRGVTKNG